jgi:hypothetical protein
MLLFFILNKCLHKYTKAKGNVNAVYNKIKKISYVKNRLKTSFNINLICITFAAYKNSLVACIEEQLA